jgi:hypothetical protein
MFVDTAAKDFHLRTGSPCIDAGVDVGQLFGGTAPDIGRWETGIVGVEKRDLRSANPPLFSAQPNPFSQAVRFMSPRPLKAVAVYALNGACVARFDRVSGSSVNWTPAAGLAKGLYVVKGTTIEGNTHTLKVMLSR